MVRMLTFGWDDLQPKRDQQPLYSQGLAGCKKEPNGVSVKLSALAGMWRFSWPPLHFALMPLGLCPHGLSPGHRAAHL